VRVGDLVRGSSAYCDVRGVRKPMLVVDMVSKKCWRTEERGSRIDWKAIDPEPHAVVFVDGRNLTIPLTDLKVFCEAR